MASKVIVKIPVAPFGQVNKSKSVNGELVVAQRVPEVISRSTETLNKGPENARVAQLEQDIRFLRDQHDLMLKGLHTEIDSLKNRNRDLQFQLIFIKGSVPSSPSSPEDDSKPKTYGSPTQVNVTPLQIELLEKELGELKLQFQEAESRNVYLSAIVDEQKKKLERYERDREKERERALQPDPEILRKLDDAEAIIRRLRRENSDLRRENSTSASSPPHYQQRDQNYQRGASSHQTSNNRGNNGRHHRGGGGGNHYNRGGNWFPPLHSQSYWQSGSGGGNRANNERASSVQVSMDGATLPSIQHQNSESAGLGQYHGRRGSNNNHYHHGDGRKYRGGYNKGGKPA